jgi:hypothetical protein
MIKIQNIKKILKYSFLNSTVRRQFNFILKTTNNPPIENKTPSEKDKGKDTNLEEPKDDKEISPGKSVEEGSGMGDTNLGNEIIKEINRENGVKEGGTNWEKTLEGVL